MFMTVLQIDNGRDHTGIINYPILNLIRGPQVS